MVVAISADVVVRTKIVNGVTHRGIGMLSPSLFQCVLNHGGRLVKRLIIDDVLPGGDLHDVQDFLARTVEKDAEMERYQPYGELSQKKRVGSENNVFGKSSHLRNRLHVSFARFPFLRQPSRV